VSSGTFEDTVFGETGFAEQATADASAGPSSRGGGSSSSGGGKKNGGGRHKLAVCGQCTKISCVLCTERLTEESSREPCDPFKYQTEEVERRIQLTGSVANCKMCPSCAAVIQRADGCNSIKCSSCNLYFCWLCGKVITHKGMHSNETHDVAHAHYDRSLGYLANRHPRHVAFVTGARTRWCATGDPFLDASKVTCGGDNCAGGAACEACVDIRANGVYRHPPAAEIRKRLFGDDGDEDKSPAAALRSAAALERYGGVVIRLDMDDD